MDFTASEIGSFAEERIADDVEIGVAGKAEAQAESCATSLFDVDEEFGGVVEACASVKRENAGRRLVVMRTEAVRAAVKRREFGMSLEDEIGLSAEPETRVFEMREHRFGSVFRGGSGGIGLGDVAGLRKRRRRTLLREH